MMGRVRLNIQIKGKPYWALFDGGARNTYITEDVVSASALPVLEFEKPEPVALGGQTHHVKKECHLVCLVEGLHVRTHARVIEKIGKDEEGKEIQLLIGALCMQEWGICPLPDEEKLDMTHYPKEFVEF